jgi:hypothetical protein
MSPKELLLLPARWWKVSDGRWTAQVNGHQCVLTMNNFPEEPLYTATVDEKQIDLDDAPSQWTFD